MTSIARHEDLVVADPSSGAITVFPNLGDGGLGDPVPHPVRGRPSEVALGDADGDGDLDVFFTGSAPSLSVMLNQGDGRLGTARDTPVTQPPITLGVADLDGDGNADVVMPDGSDEFGGKLNVLRGVGDGSFELPIRYGVGVGKLAIADLDGDGRRDVVGAGIDKVLVLLNRSRVR